MDQLPAFQVLVTVARRHHMGNSTPHTTVLSFTTAQAADVASEKIEIKNKLQQEFIYTAIRLY